MGLKINGSTDGSIEIDVPASCGGDHNMTLPAQAGEIACKNSDGTIDLGGATFSSDVTIADQVTVEWDDGSGNNRNDQIVIGSYSGLDGDRSRIAILDASKTGNQAILNINGHGQLFVHDNLYAGYRRSHDTDTGTTTYNTDPYNGVYAAQGNSSDDSARCAYTWMRAHTEDVDRWCMSSQSSNSSTTTVDAADGDDVNFWVNNRGYLGAKNVMYVGRIRTDASTPANNYPNLSSTSVNCYAGPGGTTYETVVYAAAYESPTSTTYSFRAARSTGGANDFLVRATDGRIYSDYGASVTNMDYAEYFEWDDGNPNSEDRVGHSVVLVGDKIRIATADDNAEDIIGIVSKEPAVVGDAAEMRWTEKYLKDEFGNTIYHDEEFVAWSDAPDDEQPTRFEDVKNAEHCATKARFEQQLNEGRLPEYIRNQGFHFTDKVKTLNPDYDPDREYVPREQRPEWEAIGLVGKLWLKPDQPVNPRWKLLKTGPTGNQRWLIR